MAELINRNDSLNDGRKKLNEAIKDSNKSKIDAEQALITANESKQQSESTQQQLDQVVIDGDSSVEAAQARVDGQGHAYGTLKQRLDEEHNQVSSQLAHIADEVFNTFKRQSESRKFNEERLSRLSKIEQFANGLYEWTYTDGVTIDNNQLKMTSGSKTHTNVALYDAIKDVRGIEVVVGSESNAIYTRLAFGTDASNFAWVGLNSSTGDVWNIQVFRVIGGELGPSVTIPLGFKPENGDKIKAIRHNQNLQIYRNNELMNTFAVTNNSPYILPNAPVKAGVAFRSSSSSWTVDNVKVFPALPRKYLHFSIDDIIRVFEDITQNKDNYESIFENQDMAFYKAMHDKYGAVFSLYTYYERAGASFNLSQMTDKFKKEFRDNADWLKIGFHTKSAQIQYGIGAQGEIHTPQQAVEHWNMVMDQIVRFASEYNVDRIPRLNYFGGTLEACKALRDDTKFSALGFLTADTVGRSNNYYLSNLEKASLDLCDDYYDSKEDLYFIRTDLRIESFQNPLGELKSRKNNVEYAGQMDILEIFTHEGSTLTNNYDKIEDIFKWALEEGYIFDFPQNYIPEG